MRTNWQKSDPYQFQWWALGLVGARPAEQKKGADKGIDGRIYFHSGGAEKTQQVILSVKAGHLHASHVRDLGGGVQRERAALGALISFEAPTKQMRAEAASAGFFETPWGRHPKIQLNADGKVFRGNKKTFRRFWIVSGVRNKAPNRYGVSGITLRMTVGGSAWLS